jgi:hypothetical protein
MIKDADHSRPQFENTAQTAYSGIADEFIQAGSCVSGSLGEMSGLTAHFLFGPQISARNLGRLIRE